MFNSGRKGILALAWHYRWWRSQRDERLFVSYSNYRSSIFTYPRYPWNQRVVFHNFNRYISPICNRCSVLHCSAIRRTRHINRIVVKEVCWTPLKTRNKVEPRHENGKKREKKWYMIVK
jgi:hypothetical protein